MVLQQLSFPFLSKKSISAPGKISMEFFNDAGCQHHISNKSGLYHQKFLQAAKVGGRDV